MIKKIRRLVFSDTSKDTFITLVGNGIVAVSGATFTILVARGLKPAQFGVLSALTSTAILLASLGDMGISSALVNFIPKFKSDRDSIVSLSFWLQIIITAFIVLLILAASPWHSQIIPGSTLTHFLLLTLLTTAALLSFFAQSLFKAERNFLYASTVQIIESVGKLIPIGILFFFFGLQIRLILLSIISSITLAAIVGLSGELKNISFIFPRKYLNKIFHFSKWVAIMRGFSVAISRIDVILLNALGTSHQAGIYAAASRITMLFALLVSSLGSVIAPRFSAFSKKKQVVTYIKKVSLLIGGVSVLMALSIILAPLIVNTVFGVQYQAAIPVFRYLTLAMIPFLLSIITTNPLIYFFNKPNFTALSTAIQVSLLVVIEIVLIPSMGAMAPTLALAISNIVVFALTGYKLHKLLK